MLPALILFKLAVTGASVFAGVKGYQHSKPAKKNNTVPKSDKISGKEHASRSDQAMVTTDTVSPDEPDREHIEKIVNQKIAATGASLALSTAGVVTGSSVLLPMAVPGLIYIGVPMIKDAYDAVFKDRQSRASILDAISITAMLGTGHLVVCSLAGFLLTGK
ncbi:MAG: hypothetical protein HC887_11040 [Desulfobacteraceae bacterium]|nr:hypothetical protein [Desulfobacteraceae bacterium]